MLNSVLLDYKDPLLLREKRFYSCLKLIADEAKPVVFYLQENWAKHQALRDIGLDPQSLCNLVEVSQSVGTEVDITESSLQNLDNLLPISSHDPKSPLVGYLEAQSSQPSLINSDNRVLGTVGNSFVLSPSPIVNHATLIDQGLNANSAILMLAATGLDLAIPNISVDLLADHEISELRETLETERTEYLVAMTSLAEETFDGLRAGDLSELHAWARNRFYLSVAPKIKELELATSKQRPNLLKKLGYSFFKNGVPVIGAAYIANGLRSGAAVTAGQLLASLVEALSDRSQLATAHEISYAMKIKEALDLQSIYLASDKI